MDDMTNSTFFSDTDGWMRQAFQNSSYYESEIFNFSLIFKQWYYLTIVIRFFLTNKIWVFKFRYPYSIDFLKRF